MSFKIIRFSASRWDMWPRVDLPFVKDVALITGTNGSGKTTILHGLQLVLGVSPATRSVNHYLKVLGGPAVLLVVCTNPPTGVKGSRLWQAVDRNLVTENVTVACRVELHNGDLRYRYRVLPGSLTLEEADAQLALPDAWGLKEYRNALKHVVDSKTLKDLIIEQGDIAEFSTKDGKERYRMVQNRLLDRATIDQYRIAIEKLEEAKQAVYAKDKALREVEMALRSKQRQAQQRRDYNILVQAEQEARATFEASSWQHHTAEVTNAGTAKTRLEAAISARQSRWEKLDNDLQAATARREKVLAEIGALRAEAAKHRKEGTEAAERAGRLTVELEQLLQAVNDLPNMTTRPESIIKAEREALYQQQVGAEARRTTADQTVQALKHRIEELQAGRPEYPPEVKSTLAQFAKDAIRAKLLAESVQVTKQSNAWVEGMLGPLRFALSVSPDDAPEALRVARECNFPGPVYSGSMTSKVGHGLKILDQVPDWLPAHLDRAKPSADGWSTPEGQWVVQPDKVLAGQDHAELLETLNQQRKAELEQAASASRQGKALGKQVADLYAEGEQARIRDQTKERLLKRPILEKELESSRKAASALQGRAQELEEKAIVKETRMDPAAIAQIRLDLSTLHSELADHKRDLTAEQQRLRISQATLESLVADVPGLASRAQSAKPVVLSQAETDHKLAQERLNKFDTSGMPDNDDIFAQEEIMTRSFRSETDELAKRSKIRDEQQDETEKTRVVYLRQIVGRLQRYKERLEHYGKYIEATIEVELPTFNEKTTIEQIESAKLDVAFGFDGKEPLPSGHSDFSGGQKVLQSLVQLMALDDAERAGFFIVDEPYHNLSVDRVEQVAKFLRNVGPQFIVTAPTGISKQMFGTATQFISVDKRPTGSKHAPHPRIGSKELMLV